MILLDLDVHAAIAAIIEQISKVVRIAINVIYVNNMDYPAKLVKFYDIVISSLDKLR